MHALPFCPLILVAIAATATSAPLERPPATITQQEAKQFASDVWQMAEAISAQYVREVPRNDLVIAALKRKKLEIKDELQKLRTSD